MEGYYIAVSFFRQRTGWDLLRAHQSSHFPILRHSSLDLGAPFPMSQHSDVLKL